jgi:hypothetical protein
MKNGKPIFTSKLSPLGKEIYPNNKFIIHEHFKIHLVMKRFCLFSFCVCLMVKGRTQFSITTPSSHSHNDYYQNQPFTTAFEAGMASIEADVFFMATRPYFNNYKNGWWRKAVLCTYTCERLKKIVDFVHSKGKKMRFWLTPDNPNAWKTLSDLGVDFINTDTPKALKAFLNDKLKETILAHNR